MTKSPLSSQPRKFTPFESSDQEFADRVPNVVVLGTSRVSLAGMHQLLSEHLIVDINGKLLNDEGDVVMRIARDGHTEEVEPSEDLAVDPEECALLCSAELCSDFVLDQIAQRVGDARLLVQQRFTISPELEQSRVVTMLPTVSSIATSEMDPADLAGMLATGSGNYIGGLADTDAVDPVSIPDTYRPPLFKSTISSDAETRTLVDLARHAESLQQLAKRHGITVQTESKHRSRALRVLDIESDIEAYQRVLIATGHDLTIDYQTLRKTHHR